MPFILPFAVANTAIISEPKIEHLGTGMDGAMYLVAAHKVLPIVQI